MRTSLLFLVFFLPGFLFCQRIDYKYRAPFEVLDTFRVTADFYDERGFNDSKEILMICGGKAIPAIVDNKWGSSRCYEWMRYFKIDGVEIDPEKLIVMYGIGEDFAAWRVDK